jgi:hypothetical protein
MKTKQKTTLKALGSFTIPTKHMYEEKKYIGRMDVVKQIFHAIST